MKTHPPFSPIDLHLHSTASDGVLSPSDLMREVADAGVRMAALTDHDSVNGLHEAGRQAGALGLELIPGVEMTALWQRKTLHILGLGIDARHPDLRAYLEGVHACRLERAQRIARRLRDAGIEGALDGARALAGKALLTRPHFARYLVAQGHARDVQEAFRHYLARGRPGHVATQWASMETVIEHIHGAGGIAVLAHPLRYRLTASWMRRLLGAFVDSGGEAMEVSCGHYSRDEFEHSIRLARHHGLQGSQGSDFHGYQSPWTRPGRIPPLPESIPPVWASWC